MISVLLPVLTALLACGGARVNVPSVVQNALRLAYPAVTAVDWERNGNNYEAEFDSGGKEISVLLSGKGELLMQKEDVQPQHIPSPIHNLIASAYSGYVIEEAEKISRGSTVYYQLALDAGMKQEVELVLSTDGLAVAGTHFWD